MNGFRRIDGVFPEGVTAIQTMRHGLGASQPPFDSCNMGTRSGDCLNIVTANRKALVEHAALPEAPRWLRQVHGVGVVVEPEADEPEGDASITRESGRVLTVLTADCLPVLFAATDGREVAAAHAGWRGLAAGVLEQTTQHMNTPAEHIVAWLGPAAGKHRYEIGQDVFDAFTQTDPNDADCFTPTRTNHWLVDLYTLATRRLVRAGLSAVNIHGGNECTISQSDDYFSYRRDGQTGRQASLIWLNLKNP